MPSRYHNIHVAVQQRGRPDDLYPLPPADAPSVVWVLWTAPQVQLRGRGGSIGRHDVVGRPQSGTQCLAGRAAIRATVPTTRVAVHGLDCVHQVLTLLSGVRDERGQLECLHDRGFDYALHSNAHVILAKGFVQMRFSATPVSYPRNPLFKPPPQQEHLAERNRFLSGVITHPQQQSKLIRAELNHGITTLC